MALNTRNLTAPGDVQAVDGLSVARSLGAGGAQMPTWGVGDPVATAVAGFQKGMERFKTFYDRSKADEFLLNKKLELDDMFYNKDTGLCTLRKGEDAQGLYQECANKMRDIWNKDAQDGLSDTQRALVSKGMTTLFSDFSKKIATYETDQMIDGTKNRINNTIFNLQNSIANGLSSEEELAMGLHLLRSSHGSLGALQGLDDETIQVNTAKDIGKMLTQGAISYGATDGTKALGFLESYKDMIPAEMYEAARQTVHNASVEQKLKTGRQILITQGRDAYEQFINENSNNPRESKSNITAGGYTYPAGGRENNTPEYVTNVEKRTGLKADTVIDPNDAGQMAKLIHAMSIQESGLIKRTGLSVEDIKYMLETGKDPESLDYSKLGKDRAERNLNPGNIIDGKGGFRKYKTLAEGFRAHWENLKDYKKRRGCVYLADYIYTWAPPTSNGWSAKNKGREQTGPVLTGADRFNGKLDADQTRKALDESKTLGAKIEADQIFQGVMAQIQSMPATTTAEERSAKFYDLIKDVKDTELHDELTKLGEQRLKRMETEEKAGISMQYQEFERIRKENPLHTISDWRQIVLDNPNYSKKAQDFILKKLDNERNSAWNKTASAEGLRQIRKAFDQSGGSLSEAEIRQMCVDLDLSASDTDKALNYLGRDELFAQYRIDGLAESVYGKKNLTDGQKDVIYDLFMSWAKQEKNQGKDLTNAQIKNVLAKFKDKVLVNDGSWFSEGSEMEYYKAVEKGYLPIPNENDLKKIYSYYTDERKDLGFGWLKQAKVEDRMKIESFLYMRDFLKLPVVLSSEDEQMIRGYQQKYTTQKG